MKKKLTKNQQTTNVFMVFFPFFFKLKHTLTEFSFEVWEV